MKWIEFPPMGLVNIERAKCIRLEKEMKGYFIDISPQGERYEPAHYALTPEWYLRIYFHEEGSCYERHYESEESGRAAYENIKSAMAGLFEEIRKI